MAENRAMNAGLMQSPRPSAIHPAKPGDVVKQPGHWVLAGLGKRVLRPGGLALTRELMAHLNPCDDDSVVEFAPGLGVTARIALAQQPRSYVGIEREPDAARLLQQELGNENVQFVLATAESTSLHSDSASLVFGEAMLSMQTPGKKQRILAEAFRILKPGGRYGIHELALLPNEIPDDERKAIEREMSTNIHVGVRPATLTEWKRILEEAGFHVDWEAQAPMHLLEPKRLLNDEGPLGVLRILFNLLRKPIARHRVLSMRRLFRKYASHLSAVAIVCTKPAPAGMESV